MIRPRRSFAIVAVASLAICGVSSTAYSDPVEPYIDDGGGGITNESIRTYAAGLNEAFVIELVEPLPTISPHDLLALAIGGELDPVVNGAVALVDPPPINVGIVAILALIGASVTWSALSFGGGLRAAFAARGVGTSRSTNTFRPMSGMAALFDGRDLRARSLSVGAVGVA